MHYLLTCRAPRPFRPSEECGKEFVSLHPGRLYCSESCRNRMHRRSRVNRERALGYGAAAHPLTTSIVSEKRVNDQIAEAAGYASSSTIAEMAKALNIARITDIDSEAELAKIGYRSDKRAERWDDPPPATPAKPAPKADTSAEPKKVLSSEDSPPQFQNEEWDPGPDGDPYADYQSPKDEEL